MATLKLSKEGFLQRKRLKGYYASSTSNPLFIRSTGEKIFRWVDLTPVERRALRKQGLQRKYDKNDECLRKIANLEADLISAKQMLDESILGNDLHSAKYWIKRIEYLMKNLSYKHGISNDVQEKIAEFNRLDTLNLLKENSNIEYKDRRMGDSTKNGLPKSDFARDNGQFGSMPSFEGEDSHEN